MYLKMTEDLLADYREIFYVFDENGDGAISPSEITKVMNFLGENPSTSQVSQLIAEVDHNDDGEVDFNEFVCLMVKHLVRTDNAEEELVTVFKRFDRDHDGEISADDLMQMLTELGHPCDRDEVENMIYFFDTNQDGTIGFEEFI